MKKKKLSSNMEDYLEAIAVAKKRNGVARVKNIGSFLKVKTSSVTSALNTLSKKGLVVHERYGYIELTPDGKTVAESVLKRHNVLVKFLVKILRIGEKTAVEDACKMEHAVSSKTFHKLTEFIRFTELGLNGREPEWLKNFDYYLKTGRKPKCKVIAAKKKGAPLN